LSAKSYANGMLARGVTLQIGGQIGWDGDREFVSDGFIGQMRQALSNIRSIVESADGGVEDVTRLTWIVTDRSECLAAQQEVGETYQGVFGRHFPARSMLAVAGPVEIETEAHLG